MGALAQQDDTGTNPLAFTFDWRTSAEMQTLGNGDNSFTSVTTEYSMPLGSQFSFRFRMRHNSLSLDPEEDGSSTETSGLGDMDARLLWIASLNQSAGLAFGLEGQFPTATNIRLGSGKYTLGPQVFGVLFRPPGGGALVAPAYQYVFSYAGEDGRSDVRRSQFDLFYLWLGSTGKWWVLADPQAVIDHENDVEFGLFEAEYGRMMFGGISAYWRPSIGIGSDRPYDWSVQIGFKVIWR